MTSWHFLSFQAKGPSAGRGDECVGRRERGDRPGGHREHDPAGQHDRHCHRASALGEENLHR
eukprot:scaffold3469_cov246-Pinguiococcus_pyrenoidosus.AAC.7